jgi:ANTAR domain
MAADGVEASAASSDDHIPTLAQLEFVLGEGPSHDAFKTGRPVLVPDLAASNGRWVGYTPAAVAAGIGGVYVFPLGLGAIRLGVLACYSDLGRRLQHPELGRCLTVAEDVTSLLLSGFSGDGELADPDVQETLQIRTEVYQAQGMLHVALGVTLTEALVRLRAMAYAEGIDVNDLARDVVAGRRAFPTQANDTR